ncbi:MAG: ferrous iron transporter B [Lachnospiraceae bacterium]|nr:ferrous iron transporter B [Lachnospiraceae bacterium]
MGIKIALAGNPNCGKTTLFNALTGSNQFVGNWPGVTVEKKEGKLKIDKEVILTDLPGIYSLSPYTLEEVVARNYLIDERPDAILNIVDGSNLERNLYLTTQLMELGISVVMAVNMMDVVKKNGDQIHTNKLSKELGIPVVEISALKGEGIEEAAKKAVNVAKLGDKTEPKHLFSGSVEHAIGHIEELLLHDKAAEEQRWYAIKLFERDEKVIEKLNLSKEQIDHIEQDIVSCEKELDDDAESIITAERYTYIGNIIGKCLKKSKRGADTVSDKIDKIVTNRIFALPIFAVVMFLVYYIAVTTIGTYATDWTNDGLFGDGFHWFGMGTSQYEEAMTEYAVDNVWTDEVKSIVDAAADAGVIGAEDIQGTIEEKDFAGFEEAYGSYGEKLAEDGFDISEVVDEALESENVPATEEYGSWCPGIPVIIGNGLDAAGFTEDSDSTTKVIIRALILDGIVAGVGAVLGFVPQMLVLFILLAILESCGYMARVAFIMDRIFRKFGLSGKSFIPMLIGTGCGVPGVMASRTIENDRDRKMTIMTTTFIPCGAKIPIIALIAASLFDNSVWVAYSAYLIGIAAIVCSGIILKKTKMFAGDPAPFVMELPPYHVPTFDNVMRSMWERGWSFIKKAGTIILLSSILIWAGSVFGFGEGGFGFDPEMDLENSILGKIGNAVCWIFAPLGFGTIKATIATVMGLVAKEEVVGVFGVLDFEGLSQIAGYSFMAFNLLCAPCFAAMGAIKREMNNAKWFWFAIGYQCVLAYIVALCIFQIGSLFIAGSFGIGTVIALLLIVLFIYLLFRPYKESTTFNMKLKRATSK